MESKTASKVCHLVSYDIWKKCLVCVIKNLNDASTRYAIHARIKLLTPRNN